jgi:hypothetical protein
MKRFLIKPAVILFVFALCVSFAEDVKFEEVNGLVVMEAESVPLDGNWQLKTGPLTNYTGTGYIQSVSSGTNVYPIAFKNTGVYHFMWRNAAPHKTENNDSYIRMVGGESVIKSENRNACLSGGWAKVFNNASGDKWSWQTRNCDGTYNHIFIHINKPGDYTLEVKKRSSNHKIDRIVFNNRDKISDQAAQELTLQETRAGQGVAIQPLRIRTKKHMLPKQEANLFMPNGCLIGKVSTAGIFIRNNQRSQIFLKSK